MANAYADLATLKSPAVLNVPDDASRRPGCWICWRQHPRWIDGYCGRQFFATHGERRV